MSVRAGDGYGDDDRLPWLETVEDEYREGPSALRIVLLVLLGLAVIATAIFGYYWYQHSRGQGGNGELIQAPEGDYKVKPDDAGGMKVESEGDAVFATSEGEAANASVDTDAVPEAPIAGTKASAPKAAAPGAAKVDVAVPASGGKLEAQSPARKIPATVSAPAGVASGALIQLGAFPDEGGANITWARLSKRFGYLAPLGKSIERGTDSAGKTVWRLRVNAGSNGQAKDLCGRLKVAGENCYVAN